MQYQKSFRLNTNQSPKTTSLFLLLVTTLSTINIASATHSHEIIGTTNPNADSTPQVINDKSADTGISKQSNGSAGSLIASVSKLDKPQATVAEALPIKLVTKKTISSSAESDSNFVNDTQYTITHIKPITEIVPKENTDAKFTGVLIHAPSGNASYKIKPSE